MNSTQQYEALFKNWKRYNYYEYLEFIDGEKTKYLKSLVNDRDNNPLKYYENLKKYGHYINLNREEKSNV